tara:strand:- start:580 stop:957 length:378 start_codon:yes stop_codon:yes gene_type:complete
MVTFRNNNRRLRFRNNERNFKRNSDNKFKSDFSANSSFHRKSPGRNNHNASKLIEKYNDLAREALANGDKILSENYFQHADHFARVIEEQEKKKSNQNSQNLETHKVKENSLENHKETEKNTISN